MAEVGCKNDVIVSFFGQNFLTVKGKMCKYQFGNNLTPYQTAAAAAHFVAQQKMGKKWHMLANNYSWPQMFERAYSLVAKQVGAEWTGVTWAPLGTRDFLPFLPKVAAAKADVVFITTWAADQVACAKQVQEFGLAKQAQVIHSITELTFAEAAGKGVYENFYAGMPWYWSPEGPVPGGQEVLRPPLRAQEARAERLHGVDLLHGAGAPRHRARGEIARDRQGHPRARGPEVPVPEGPRADPRLRPREHPGRVPLQGQVGRRR